MKQAFDGMGDTLTVLSVSPWLKERAMQSPILAEKSHRVVMNGLDTAVFCPGEDNGLKEAYGLADKRIVFHATAAFSDDPAHLKGGYYLLKLAEQWKDEPIQIVVAAGETALSETPPPNVTLLGRVEDPRQLAAWYRAADVTVITSRRETFSMVCAESLCCGTPVVGFAAGGPETIALPAYSQFVEQGDVEGLRRGIEQMMLADHDPAAVAAAAQVVYDRRRLAEETLAVYRDLMKGNAPCL
jgi:glycosyltransferase involved in cell wall biosynthesis